MEFGAARSVPKTWFDRLIDALALVAGLLLCSLALLVCLDVATRALHVMPMPWTLDVSQHALYAVTFCGAPWVLREQGHIAIEIVVERLSPGARNVARRLVDALGALVCLVLVVYACRVLARSYQAGNMVYETFVYPEWWQYVLAPPVFLMLLAIHLRRFRRPGTDAQPAGAPSDGI
ncbi:MAG TPA: TRAP transporter small permease [Burkholderiales bacterium]|nr:TRAP transporter small permease [Burkholderiales bacterium]